MAEEKPQEQETPESVRDGMTDPKLQAENNQVLADMSAVAKQLEALADKKGVVGEAPRETVGIYENTVQSPLMNPDEYGGVY